MQIKKNTAFFCKRQFMIVFLFGIIMLSCNGCITGTMYLLAGNADANYPNYEESDLYLKQPTNRIISEKHFSPELTKDEIKKYIEQNVSQAIGAEITVADFELVNTNPAAKLVVYRFPKANWKYMKSLGEGPFMAVGMTFGAAEVFDPILLPFAIYQHILSYGGERYVSVFFDAQDHIIHAFGFNVLNGEIARPPTGAVNFMHTWKAWFSHGCDAYTVREDGNPLILLDKTFYLMDGTLCTPEKR